MKYYVFFIMVTMKNYNYKKYMEKYFKKVLHKNEIWVYNYAIIKMAVRKNS